MFKITSALVAVSMLATTTVADPRNAKMLLANNVDMAEFHQSTMSVVQKGQIVEHKNKMGQLHEPGFLNKGVHHLIVSDEL